MASGSPLKMQPPGCSPPLEVCHVCLLRTLPTLRNDVILSIFRSKYPRPEMLDLTHASWFSLSSVSLNTAATSGAIWFYYVLLRFIGNTHSKPRKCKELETHQNWKNWSLGSATWKIQSRLGPYEQLSAQGPHKTTKSS